MASITDPLRELEPFDSSLNRKPVNIFELIAYVLTYKDTIYVRTADGQNTPISKLPPHQAAATVSRFVDAFIPKDDLGEALKYIPHRVITDDLDRETMQHASWQVLALRDWAKVAQVWEGLKKEGQG